MNLINKLFNKPKVDCPRCLGKGNVDWDDIKRLGQELKWLPGECAYCNATGKVTSEMLSKISVDNMYLTTDITQDERQKLINNDSDALERAAYYEMEVNGFIKQVEYLYFNANLNLGTIVEFYLINKTELEISPSEKEKFIDYIERIIEHKKTKYN
ncbi:hypothetical protein ABGT15_13105 [Flavobacterium enshiense]|uniref:hypothetical protein n=1 Tax=Flavobacterium enshiense TaxID=1341165 RepID=UPI00345CF202